jgi:hypothetical protein
VRRRSRGRAGAVEQLRCDGGDEDRDGDDDDEDGDGQREAEARAVFKYLAQELGRGRRRFALGLADHAAQPHVAQLPEGRVDQREEDERQKQRARDGYLNFHKEAVSY